MTEESTLPLLPLLLDHVPEGLECALEQEGVPVVEFDDDPEGGRFVLFDGRNTPPPDCQPGQGAIDVAAWVAAIEAASAQADAPPAGVPRDSADALVTCRATAESPLAAWLRVLPELRTAIEQAGGIWLRVAPYPFPYRSVLNYRIDYAAWQPEWRLPLRGLTAAVDSATSHYYGGRVVAAAHKDGGLEGQDLGTLGHDPRVFASAQDNMDNVGRAIEAFRAIGLRALGFATLHDRVPRNLTSTLELQGLSHCAYAATEGDALPWFAPAGHLLHLPAHPSPLEELLAPRRSRAPRGERPAGADSKSPDAREPLDEWLRAAYRTGTPLLLRGSAEAMARVDDASAGSLLAAAAAREGLWATTLSQLARWWRDRASVALCVRSEPGGYVVQAEHLPDDFAVGVEFARGKHAALLPLGSGRIEFSPDGLVYEKREMPGARPRITLDGRQRPHFRVQTADELSDDASALPAEARGADWRRWARRAVNRWWRRPA